MESPSQEITRAVELCDANGKLNPAAAGWARHPLWRCNLKGRPLRKKRWDYWCFMGEQRLFSICIAHIDYLGLMGGYLLDYATGELAEFGTGRPFGRYPTMPDTTDGEAFFEYGPSMTRQMLDRNAGDITVSSPNCKGRPLSAVFQLLTPPEQETLNVVVPWPHGNFQFTSKQLPLPCEGEVRWGDEVWRFDAATTYGVRDFGRGVWPYRTNWNWAALSGKQDGAVWALNLGGQWTDNTNATENGLLLDGVLHKIHHDAVFERDKRDPMKPWKLYTPGANAVDLVLTPFFDKHTNMNLGLLKTVVHQCFGHFEGTIRAGGCTVDARGALGWAEEQAARW